MDEPTSRENKRMSRANLNKDPDEVAAMFDGVAKRYDLVNDLLSLGRTKAWRKAATKIIAPAPGMVILDLAAGPGSSSEPLFKAGATVFATDFSEGMLAQGRKARPYLNFSKADALNLPFEADTFDVVTISYGLRNTADFDKALAEARRVTKPGGRMVVVEFSHPTWRPFRTIYTEYLMKLLPMIAKKTSSNPDAYIYLTDYFYSHDVGQTGILRSGGHWASAGYAGIGCRNSGDRSSNSNAAIGGRIEFIG